MLSLFKNDNVLSVLFLVMLALLLRLPLSLGFIEIYTPLTIQGSWYSLLFNNWTHQFPLLSAGVAMLFVCFQAVLLNRMVANYRMLRDRTQVYGQLYMVFCSMIPAFLFLSAPLVAVSFVLLALNNIFALYRSKNVEANIFNAVFWIVIGSFFYPLTLWLLPVFMIAVALLHTIRFRDILVFLSGIIVPWFLFWGFSFVVMDTMLFWENVSAYGVAIPKDIASTFLVFPSVVYVIVVSLLLLWIVFSFNSYFSRKLIQIQKYITVFYWLLVFVLFSFFFQREIGLEHLLLLAPTIGFFLGHSFQLAKNKLVAEYLFLALFCLAFSLHFL